jgi:hypothetical protein
LFTVTLFTLKYGGETLSVSTKCVVICSIRSECMDEHASTSTTWGNSWSVIQNESLWWMRRSNDDFLSFS